MIWHFFHRPETVSEMLHNDENLEPKRIEIVFHSKTMSLIALACIFTMIVNTWICYIIYSRRHLRSSCTALIVANVAIVDIIVTTKDFPYLLSVFLSSTWYFEIHWCGSYGLTNVIYIIVSVSTLVSITTDLYLFTKEKAEECTSTRDLTPPDHYKVALLGYVIAQTTLSYSLSLLWSKYAFLARKAFCQVKFSSTAFPASIVVSILFLIPIATLTFSMLGSLRKVKKRSNNTRETIKSEFSSESDNDRLSEEDNEIHRYLQAAIGMFLLSWCFYIVDGFYPSPHSPSIPGVISAFIPIMINSLVPLFYVLTHKRGISVCYSSSSSKV